MYEETCMNLETIRQKWKNSQWQITAHARRRMGSRQIGTQEIGDVILKGEIIETYLDDEPFPSCLMMGKIRQNLPLYVVCALGDDLLHIITTHWMDPEKWLDPKTRRDKKV